MYSDRGLKRFLDAQSSDYSRALGEIRHGKKQSHWMWYIFPQLAGLGSSETAKFYALHNLDEARDYLTHPVLGSRLVEISKALLTIEGKTANQILGSPDDMKLHSCMTLFSQVEPTDPVFRTVLDRYYGGLPDQRTLALL